MVEINNQRKAFLDMLAWSEGTDNGRQKTRNHGYDVIVGGEPFTDYSDHPRKLVTLNPKLKSTGRTLPAFPVAGCLPQAAWPERLLSEKSDAVALQQIKERGALPMIEIAGYPLAKRRCGKYLASMPALVCGQSAARLPDCKIKEARNKSD